MSYSVIFAIDFGALPDASRPEVARVMTDIADAVDSIPDTSPFFTSMGQSVLQVDAGGFRIGYRLDPRLRELRVIEASPLRR